MHELASVNEAIRRVMGINPIPKKIIIRLGEMRGSAKTFEEMFREHSKGTPIEHINLKVESVPVDIACKCGFSGRVRVFEHVYFVRCPECGNIADVLNGNGLEIEVIE